MRVGIVPIKNFMEKSLIVTTVGKYSKISTEKNIKGN